MDGTTGPPMLDRQQRRALREVLVQTTAAAGRSRSSARIEPLVAAAPIAALPRAASLHRVAGSVLRGLDGVNGVPDEVTSALAALRQRAVLRHLLIASPLARLCEAFASAGISWVVMKGPVIATLLYPDVGDRSYGDLDLLVDRRDFARATRLLEELGYRHHIHDWALAQAQMAGEILMSDDHVSVDLHWHLHYSHEDRRALAVQPEAMIARHRRVDVAGTPIPTFDPVDTLLTLAFHAARSDGHRLVWSKDIERSLAVEEPDLDELVRRARLAGCPVAVGVMLARARTLLGADVPRAVTDALVPAPLRAIDMAVSSLVSPIQLHEEPTVTRAMTRSMRSSFWATLVDVPGRGVRTLRRRFSPPIPTETDDPDEKRRYLEAVVRSYRS